MKVYAIDHNKIRDSIIINPNFNGNKLPEDRFLDWCEKNGIIIAVDWD